MQNIQGRRNRKNPKSSTRVCSPPASCKQHQEVLVFTMWLICVLGGCHPCSTHLSQPQRIAWGQYPASQAAVSYLPAFSHCKGIVTFLTSFPLTWWLSEPGSIADSGSSPIFQPKCVHDQIRSIWSCNSSSLVAPYTTRDIQVTNLNLTFRSFYPNPGTIHNIWSQELIDLKKKKSTSYPQQEHQGFFPLINSN